MGLAGLYIQVFKIEISISALLWTWLWFSWYFRFNILFVSKNHIFILDTYFMGSILLLLVFLFVLFFLLFKKMVIMLKYIFIFLFWQLLLIKIILTYLIRIIIDTSFARTSIIIITKRAPFSVRTLSINFLRCIFFGRILNRRLIDLEIKLCITYLIFWIQCILQFLWIFNFLSISKNNNFASFFFHWFHVIKQVHRCRAFLMHYFNTKSALFLSLILTLLFLTYGCR